MTSAAVRTAWSAGVFQHATIQSYTTKVHQFDAIAALKSGKEAELFLYNQKVNFFQQTVTRTGKNGEIRGNNTSAERYEYDVEVAYYLERDIVQGDHNYNAALDRLEVMDELVRTQLGKSWSGSVDYWTVTGILKPQLVTIDERDVWACGYSYLGVESV